MDFIKPENLKELLDAIDAHPDYLILAGGTDICVLLNSNQIDPDGIISIWGINELRGIKEEKNHISIGALTTHTEIANHPAIKKHLPALIMSCKQIGARQIQNRGTIGGNIINASPAGDTLPVLLAAEAIIGVQSRNSKKEIPFEKLYTGYRQTSLKDNEIITSIKIPKFSKNYKSHFIKIGTRKAQSISKVMGGLVTQINNGKINEIKIALGCVGPTPLRLKKTEKFLYGKKLNEKNIREAALIASKEVTPITDIRSTEKYRKHISGIIVKRLLGKHFKK